ncbi:MAG: hypothetical protein ABSD78_05965 [Acidimicrobiales bacterium]|jgi:hypothetical protein
MTDVILVVTILVFFLAASQLVRVCDRLAAHPADDGDNEPEEPA